MAKRALLALAGLVHALQAEPLPPAFAEQLRCPFARVWLEHGAERAAEILGVAPHAVSGARRLSTPWGTCTYNNPFAGMTCMEFRGGSWDDATAASRCSSAMQNVAGTLAKNATCATTADLAGWCQTNGGAEWTPMDITAQSATCTAVEQSCRTWSQGAFTPAGRCAQSGSAAAAPTTPAPNSSGRPSGPSGQGGQSWGGGGGGAPGRCLLAPGAIGAAHQLGQSQGYDTDCPGTPAQQSPYMWPLRWSAVVEQKGLPYRTDVVSYESRGRVWYMLDRNWKRLDTWYQSGVQRAVGQGPCETPVNGTALACNRTGSRNTTMLHRNNKMVFIDWAANGSIESCAWQDLSVIGNVRPDWYMDDRGDSTDVQYLGDSHVYYLGEPRLVKQWRKKDFANQYFTMSVQRLAGPDGIHWPLILNIPGEGFGDDFLQHWHGHRVLNESEASEFLLDEAHVRSGGACPQRGGSGSSGPPTGQVAHVPSNLEVDQAAWHTVVYTASPVWVPPSEGGTGGDASALTKRIAAGVMAEACVDGATSTLRLSLAVDLAAPAWVAVGFRSTEECLMTPRGGGDGEIVFAQPGNASAYEVHYGPLSPETKHFTAAALSNFLGRMTLLSGAAGFSDGTAEYGNGRLVLGFARSYSVVPPVFNLSYAYGNSAQLGYHASRGCFTLTPVACPMVCRSVPGNNGAMSSGSISRTGGGSGNGSGGGGSGSSNCGSSSSNSNSTSNQTSGAALPVVSPSTMARSVVCMIFLICLNVLP